MTSPAKRKGDAAELEAARYIADLTGWPARRKLGAGRTDDTGDIDGVPNCTIQIKNYRDVLRGIREAVDDLETQRTNAGTTHACAWIRRPGGRWIVVLTPELWATLMREAVA